jgi:hypothetical protein
MGKLRLLIQEEPFYFAGSSEDHADLERWPDNRGGEYGYGLPQGSEYWMRVHNVGAFVIRNEYRDALGFPDPGISPARFRAAFFHGVAPWLLQRREWDVLHGSAVRTPAGVVVFCGSSDRGKSTLARAWVDRGVVAYADDSVPFVVRNGTALSACLPQELRLRGGAAARFPNPVAPAWRDATGPEIRCDLEPTLHPIRCIYGLAGLFDQGAEAARIEPVSQVEALPLMLKAAHCMTLRDPACNRKMVANYLALVRATPIFRLGVIADLDRLPEVLNRLEHHHRSLLGT